ncbi:MAG TPA: hypothetical protein ACHBX0_13175 [Arsenophonus sp.]
MLFLTVVEEHQNGLVNIRQIDWQTNQQKTIIYTAWIGYNPESDSQTLRYGYLSLTTLISVLQINMLTGQRESLKQQRVNGFYKQYMVLKSNIGNRQN